MPVYAARRLATLGIWFLGAVFMGQNNPGYDSYTYSEGSIRQPAPRASHGVRKVVNCQRRVTDREV